MNIEDKPHKAVIHFRIDICPILLSGELEEIVDESVYEQNNIKRNAVFSISGFNRKDCIERLLEVLKKLNG